jgi:ABC-type transporter Mla MlaB component
MAIDSIGKVEPFINKVDWIGDMNPDIFEDNAKPGVNFHYKGEWDDSGSTPVFIAMKGLDSDQCIEFSVENASGLFEQSIRLRDDLSNREAYMMKVPDNDGLFAIYISLLKDENTYPEEIMVEFHDSNEGPGFYPHRAYWGKDLINKGNTEKIDSPDHYYMGEIPFREAGDKWVPLIVSSKLIGLSGKSVDEIVINVYNELLIDYNKDSTIELDLGGIETLDLSAIQMLLVLQKSCIQNGKEFTIFGVEDKLKEYIKIYNIEGLL